MAQSPVRLAPDQRWTLLAVCLGTFMLLLDVTVTNIALPAVRHSLGGGLDGLQWVVDGYALTLAATLLTFGSLADRFGRRRLYLLGIGLFVVASCACGAAGSVPALVAGRALQGIGGAMMFSVALALLAQSFAPGERGFAFGVWGAVTGLAVSLGPVVGGILTSGLSWRWIFWVNLPLGLATLAVTARRVGESRLADPPRVDIAGLLTFGGGLGLLVFGLIRSVRSGWAAPEVLLPVVAGAVALVAFVVVELRVARPLLDLGLFRDPAFRAVSLAAFVLSAAPYAVMVFVVLWAEQALGLSPLQTGVRLLVLSAGIIPVSAVAGRLTGAVPPRVLLAPGLAAAGAGLLLLHRIGPESGWRTAVPGLFLMGVGIGLSNPPLANTAISIVPPGLAGTASGISATFRQAGVATGVAVLGALFTASGRRGVVGTLAGASAPGQAAPGPVRAAFATGLADVALVAAVVTLLSAAAVWRLLRGAEAAAQEAAVGSAARAAATVR
jgi:EmrB/QacA subfamily drug resistance transporter